jgi:L-alanine-DL-glutamate epimerase-like enolase superfamily enzyme
MMTAARPDEKLIAMPASTPAARLPIAQIEVIPIRVPLSRTYHGSRYRMDHRSTIIARVTMEDGIVGEAYAGDEDASLLEIAQIVSDELSPVLIGQDALAVERCWQLTRPATFDILRDRRAALVACAAVDTALWDAVGKLLRLPLWRLWGGYQSSRPMILIGGYYGQGDLAHEVAAVRELGVAGMKLKVGGTDPVRDAERFRIAREVAGPDFLLAADANQAWTRQEAIDFARRVADMGLLWFEEPCRWDNDRRDLRDVRAIGGVRVCAGQSEMSAGGCRDLFEAGAVDVCNFDASWSGGPTEWRRVAALASVYGVAMAHHEEPHVSAHLLAAIPHGTYVECFHPDRDPIWWNLITNRPELVDGSLQLSERPGLGWELDRDYIEAFRVRAA